MHGRYPGEQEVMMSIFHLGELSIPDSKLALKATKLVAEVSPHFFHHCMRTFFLPISI